MMVVMRVNNNTEFKRHGVTVGSIIRKLHHNHLGRYTLLSTRGINCTGPFASRGTSAVLSRISMMLDPRLISGPGRATLVDGTEGLCLALFLYPLRSRHLVKAERFNDCTIEKSPER